MDKGLPWMENFDLGKTSACDYPEFTVAWVNTSLACIQAQESSNTTGGYKENITPAQIGAYRWFRGAEIARRFYRKNMNTVFACGVIASRQDKLKRLKEAIKNKSGASDIQKSLDKEEAKYTKIMSSMNCNQNMTEKATDKIIDRLSRSAMIEYCKYTFYLDYLEENVQSDFSKALIIDNSLGSQSGSNVPTNLEQANSIMASYGKKITTDRTRASDTMPKVVLAFQEMDRTYITHLLLVIIYDDYLKLRDQLNTYLSIVSQTFEKAYNAQDANQK
jgi:hypothetical protein